MADSTRCSTWLRRRDVAQALLGERWGGAAGRPKAVLDERDGGDLDQLRGGRLSATRSALVGMGGPELELAGDLDRPARWSGSPIAAAVALATSSARRAATRWLARGAVASASARRIARVRAEVAAVRPQRAIAVTFGGG